MTDYETNIFHSRCPYTDMPCFDKIPCIRCRINEEEKEIVRLLEEQERLEIWQEEME